MFRTLLARTVLLMGGLLVLGLLAWLALFNLAEREPRAAAMAARVADVVNLTRSALLAASEENRPALLRELSRREGIHIVPLEPEESLLPPPQNGLARLIWRETQTRLGRDTQLIVDEEDAEHIWVSFHLGPDDYWLVMPASPRRPGLPWPWIGWGALTLLLAILGGWLLVSRINRPLRQAAAAAQRLGRGEFQVRLDEGGAEEIAVLARAINRMGASLAAQEAERNLMLAGVSHDLRTPLARLRLAIEMMVQDEDERAAMIQDIDDMERLARQFVEFARLGADDEVELVDVDALCAAVAERFARHGQAVRVTGSVGSARLFADGLRRSLVNLVDNAHRHGAPPVRLELKREPDGRTLRLCVMDSGAGLTEAEMEAAVRPFYRGDKARTGAHGTGLGLAIVDRYARQGGGRLELARSPEGGLAACLVVPDRVA